MPNSLSIVQKQALSRESNSRLEWIDLDSKDKGIISAVCLFGNVEEGRKHLKLSQGGFYKRWKYLKPLYSSLLDDLPNQAIQILKASSQMAARTLADSLEAPDPTDRIKAANSILDRVTPERNKVNDVPKRKITLEEWILSD